VREALYRKLTPASSNVAEPLPGSSLSGPFSSGKAPAVPEARAKCRENLDPQQIKARDAAAILAREIMGLMAQLDCAERVACQVLAKRIESSDTAHHIIQADIDSNVKPRKQQDSASRITGRARRLQRIIGFWRAGELEGDPLKYLVPGKRDKEGFDLVQVGAFLRFYCQPSNPSVKMAHARMAEYLEEQGMKAPSYTVATRIENSLPVTVKYRGRMTGSAWRSLKPYVDRDVSMFKSNDIWVGDGHTFKARLQSPLHGQAFQPEVTIIIDWVSRKIVGWSVALSESTIAVSAAFRDAQMRTRARPIIYYSDNGSGQTGKSIDHPIFGSLARQGVGHETGIPGNPQGRGVIERLWPVVTIPLAKTYPTVLTKDADKETVRKVTQLIAKSQRDKEISPILPTFSKFISDLTETIEDYNAEHKHSDLKGMTPNQAYEAFMDPDSIVFGVSDIEIRELWMPEEERSPSRGIVRLFGNAYFCKDLVDVLEESEKIRVRYDIHDGSKVWLYRSNGEYLGEGIWDGNKVAAFPISRIEQKRVERAQGIRQRAQREIDRADSELANTIDSGSNLRIDDVQQMYIQTQPEKILASPPEPPPSTKPNLDQMGDYTLLTRLSEHPEDWTAAFRNYFRGQVAQGSRTIANALDEFDLWDEVNKQDFKVAV
jgi:putative transposase